MKSTNVNYPLIGGNYPMTARTELDLSTVSVRDGAQRILIKAECPRNNARVYERSDKSNKGDV